MSMRARRLGLLAFMLLAPATALAETDTVAVRYADCEAATNSNPEFKACLARAADKADQKLNQAYKALQGKIRAAGNEMGQSSDSQIAALTSSQKKWIAYRDDNCTFEDSLAFGGTATGGNYSGCLCALSYERIGDFERIRRQVLGEQ
jgi:uncharacterized protein YecT (DUF1311 family)